MADQMYSAEEAAHLLGLQVRTVRNYLRDGVLPGVRLGKQYRIARADLEAFTAGGGRSGGAAPSPATVAADAAGACAHVEASSVVYLDGLGAAAMDRLERTLEAACTPAAGVGGGKLRIEQLHDPDRGRLKVVIVGPLDETADILRIIDMFRRDAS